MSKITEGLDKAFAHRIQNIVRQNPKGSAAERQILNHFIASHEGVYAQNIIGSKNSKDWIKQAMHWLQLPKVLPHLKNKYPEVDFSDLEELAHRMHEDWLARIGQLEETNLPPRAGFNKKPKQKGSGYSKDDYEYTEFVPKGKEDKEAWAIKRTVAKQKLEKPKPKSMDTGFYKNYLSNRPVREFLDTGGGGDGDDELKRQVIEMYFEDGLRETEIARITGLSEIAVNNIIDQYERGDFTLDEGAVAPLYPLVVAGHPFDWNVYDLRNNKMVASVIGGDRSESKLYEIRINRNGMTNETRMPPTYVLTAGAHDNPPYKAYELVAPEGGFGKIEKSPGPGGTTKLRPDQDDILRHVFKTLGGGKYYGYDLNLVEEGLDQWDLIEKALGAKIMDVDTANELGYTDWDPNDSSGIIYLGNQKNEGILKEYDTKTIDSVVQRLPKGLTIDNFISPAFKEYLYQKYYGPMKAGWDKLWPFFNKEYNEKHGIKEYKQNPHQILSGDVNFFDDMLLVIPKGLKSNELYTRAFKEFLYKKFGDKEWTDFKNNRYAYWDAYEKLGGNKPQGFFGKLKSKIGMDENLLNTYGDQLGLDEEEAGLGSLIDDLLNPQEPKTQESSIMKGLQAEETRKQRKPLSDKDQKLIQAIWGHEQQGMLQDRDRYLVYTAKHGIEADEPNYNAAMHHVYRIYKQFPKLDYPVLVYDRKTKTPLYFDGVEDYYNKTQPLKHKTHEGYSDGAQGGSGIGVEASPIVQAYQSQVDEHINTPGGMGQSYRKYEPKVSGTSESAVMKGLREFSPTLISPDERPEEFFRNLAAQWKFGTPKEKATIEKTLKQMHYAIGDDMRYDPDGVFITGAKDYKGKSYMSWSIEELKPSQKLDEKCWDTHKQVGMKKKGGRMVPNCVPKESAVMKGIQSEEKVEEYKEIPSQRKIEFSKENPPDLYYLYQQFIQRMLNPENTIDPNEWIDKVNKHYGLNYTWKDYQKRGHNDQTNNWQKIIDKYILKKGLNEFEQLDEGMLQKLAGLALGTVLALGPKIGQADTVFTYLHPETKKFITVDDMSKVPKDAIYAMAVDTDTNQVMVLKGEGAKGQTIQPDPAAVKQGQQQAKQPQAQQPQAQQPQAQQPQAQQPQAATNQDNQQTSVSNIGFSIKGIKFGMTQKEVKEIAQKNNISTPIINLAGKKLMNINFGSLLGVSGPKLGVMQAMGMSSEDQWRANSFQGMPASLVFEEGKLVAIYIENDTNVIYQLSKQFISKFGEPSNIDNSEWQNKAGSKFDNQQMSWNNANGAAIKLSLRGDKRDNGLIVIVDPDHMDKWSKSEISKNTANLSDFE